MCSRCDEFDRWADLLRQAKDDRAVLAGPVFDEMISFLNEEREAIVDALEDSSWDAC